MLRYTYATILTLAWVAAATQMPSGSVRWYLLFPLIAVIGAWFAASRVRAGYLAFVLVSTVIIAGLTLATVFMLAGGLLLIMGGKVDDWMTLLTHTAILMLLAGSHLVGIILLRRGANGHRWRHETPGEATE